MFPFNTSEEKLWGKVLKLSKNVSKICLLVIYYLK